MKTLKISVFAVLALALMFSSCKKEDNNSDPVDLLLGTWNLSGITSKDATLTYTTGGQTYNGTWGLTLSNNANTTVTFAATNTYTSTGTFDLTFDMSATVGPLTVPAQVPIPMNDFGTGVYTRAGNTLTLDQGTADEEVWTITSETATSLVVQQAVNETIMDAYNDPWVLTGNQVITLTK